MVATTTITVHFDGLTVGDIQALAQITRRAGADLDDAVEIYYDGRGEADGITIRTNLVDLDSALALGDD